MGDAWAQAPLACEYRFLGFGALTVIHSLTGFALSPNARAALLLARALPPEQPERVRVDSDSRATQRQRLKPHCIRTTYDENELYIKHYTDGNLDIIRKNYRQVYKRVNT